MKTCPSCFHEHNHASATRCRECGVPFDNDSEVAQKVRASESLGG